MASELDRQVRQRVSLQERKLGRKLTPAQRRNVRAQIEGYKNYYEKRLILAERKHGSGTSIAMRRGHPSKNEVGFSHLDKLKEVYKQDGWRATKDYALDKGWDFTHDQWSFIFGSPKLRSHSRRR